MVLDFAAEGKYPESEGVIAAEFPLSALSEELALITQARDEVEVSTAANLAWKSRVYCLWRHTDCSRPERNRVAK